VLSTDEIAKPEDAIVNTDTPEAKRNDYVLNDKEIIQLSEWACIIEEYYKCHMDIEWAKDGQDNKLYILQARPETVHSNKKTNEYKQYFLMEKGEKICSGAGLGNKIV
jgi:pyruvate,water dikinase